MYTGGKKRFLSLDQFQKRSVQQPYICTATLQPYKGFQKYGENAFLSRLLTVRGFISRQSLSVTYWVRLDYLKLHNVCTKIGVNNTMKSSIRLINRLI